MGIAVVLLSLVSVAVWLRGLFDPKIDRAALARTTSSQLPYLQQLPAATRGKVLVVVSCTAVYPAARVDGKLKSLAMN